jgi:hypothetical protein
MTALPLHPQIEELYAAFGPEPKPATIEACRCCLDDKEVRELVRTPLREIHPDLLRRYAGKVFLTVGSNADFRYFLPRILEVSLTYSSWLVDRELVGRSIGSHGWSEFNEAQQLALEQTAQVGFKTLLRQVNGGEDESSASDLDSWLCCASHFFNAWSEWLKEIEERPTVLRLLYEYHSSSLASGRLCNGFWHDSPRKTEFLAWFLDLQDRGEILKCYGL